MNNVSVSRERELLKRFIAHSDLNNGVFLLEEIRRFTAAFRDALAQPSEQPAKRRVYGQPAAMGSYDICSHGVVGGCLRDDPEQPAKAEQPNCGCRDDEKCSDKPFCAARRETLNELLAEQPGDVAREIVAALYGIGFANSGPRNRADEEQAVEAVQRVLAALSPSVPAEVVASSDCPLCGLDSPHHHSDEEIANLSKVDWTGNRAKVLLTRLLNLGAFTDGVYCGPCGRRDGHADNCLVAEAKKFIKEHPPSPHRAPPANDEWRTAIVKRLAELGLFAADEQDDPELAVSTLETIAASANDEAVRRDALRWQTVRNHMGEADWRAMTARCTTSLALDRYVDARIDTLGQQEEKGNGIR